MMTSEFWIEKVLTAVISAVVGGAVTYLIAEIKMKKKANDAISEGLQCLLRSELIKAHKEYTAKGYIPVYAMESVNRMYTAYHNLGGNDVVTQLVEQMKELPKGSEKP